MAKNLIKGETSKISTTQNQILDLDLSNVKIGDVYSFSFYSSHAPYPLGVDEITDYSDLCYLINSDNEKICSVKTLVYKPKSGVSTTCEVQFTITKQSSVIKLFLSRSIPADDMGRIEKLMLTEGIDFPEYEPYKEPVFKYKLLKGKENKSKNLIVGDTENVQIYDTIGVTFPLHYNKPIKAGDIFTLTGFPLTGRKDANYIAILNSEYSAALNKGTRVAGNSSNIDFDFGKDIGMEVLHHESLLIYKYYHQYNLHSN